MRLKRGVQIALVMWAVVGLLPTSSPAKTRKSPPAKTVASSSSSRSTRSASVSRTRSSKRHSSKKGSTKAVAAKPRGQQSPDSDRTREIQTALIREHYLSGEPSGSWDQETRDALTKYQKDNGWQTKLIPDSRALIKLGLGPSREGLLNPDTAAISAPHLAGSSPQPGGSAN